MRHPALAVLLLAAACARRPEPAPVSRLEETVLRLPALPPCDKTIPQEWSSSWPVPVKDRGRLRYRVFFFGRDGNPAEGFSFHEPEELAMFSESGEVSECRRDGSGKPLPRDGWQPSESLDDVVARSHIFYSALDEMGLLFDSGKPLSEPEKRKVADFSANFAALSRPGSQ